MESHNNNKTRKSFSWDAELGFLLCKSIQNPFSQTKQSMYDAYLYDEYLNNRKANNFLSWKLSGQITHFECIVIVPFSIARFSTWINVNIIPVFKHFFSYVEQHNKTFLKIVEKKFSKQMVGLLCNILS